MMIKNKLILLVLSTTLLMGSEITGKVQYDGKVPRKR